MWVIPIPPREFSFGLGCRICGGLLRRDGIAVLIGRIVAGISLAATVLIPGAVWLAVKGGVELLLRATPG